MTFSLSEGLSITYQFQNADRLFAILVPLINWQAVQFALTGIDKSCIYFITNWKWYYKIINIDYFCSLLSIDSTIDNKFIIEIICILIRSN